GRVVGELRRPAHAAPPGPAAPGIPRLIHRVAGVPRAGRLPGGARRGDDDRPATRADARIAPRRRPPSERPPARRAGGVGRGRTPLVDRVGAVIPVPAVHALIVEDVIPHHLLAVLRQRERQATATGFGNGEAIVERLALGIAGVALGRGEKRLGEGRGAVG